MKQVISFISLSLAITACGANPTQQFASDENSNATSTTTVAGVSELATRIIFHKDNFVDLSDFVTTEQTSYKCLGDITRLYYTTGQDYAGAPSIFPVNPDVVDSLAPTTRPSFIKNVSVDITNTYFPLVVSGALQTDACSYRNLGKRCNADGLCGF